MITKSYATCDASGQVLWTNNVPAFCVPTGQPGQTVREFDPESWPGLPAYWDGKRFAAGTSPKEDLERARLRALERLDADYAAALGNGFSSTGWQFQTAPASLAAINGYIQAAQAAKLLGTGFTTAFKLADNSMVQIDAERWLSLGVEMAQWRQQLHDKRQLLKAAIRAAGRAELDRLVWNA